MRAAAVVHLILLHILSIQNTMQLFKMIPLLLFCARNKQFCVCNDMAEPTNTVYVLHRRNTDRMNWCGFILCNCNRHAIAASTSRRMNSMSRWIAVYLAGLMMTLAELEGRAGVSTVITFHVRFTWSVFKVYQSREEVFPRGEQLIWRFFRFCRTLWKFKDFLSLFLSRRCSQSRGRSRTRNRCCSWRRRHSRICSLDKCLKMFNQKGRKSLKKPLKSEESVRVSLSPEKDSDETLFGSGFGCVMDSGCVSVSGSQSGTEQVRKILKSPKQSLKSEKSREVQRKIAEVS